MTDPLKEALAWADSLDSSLMTAQRMAHVKRLAAAVRSNDKEIMTMTRCPRKNHESNCVPCERDRLLSTLESCRAELAEVTDARDENREALAVEFEKDSAVYKAMKSRAERAEAANAENARLAEVEAERAAALQNPEGVWRGRWAQEAMSAGELRKELNEVRVNGEAASKHWMIRAEQAEAREKAKDERIRELEGALEKIAASGPVWERTREHLISIAEEALSTPSPSQPVKVAEGKPGDDMAPDLIAVVSRAVMEADKNWGGVRFACLAYAAIEAVQSWRLKHMKAMGAAVSRLEVIVKRVDSCAHAAWHKSMRGTDIVCDICGVPPAEKLTGTGEERP